MAIDPAAPPFPPGQPVELAGRGTTFVHQAMGPPGAPVLALLHGWTATAALNWFSSLEPLSRHFRVVALDQRGHGRGIRSRHPFRLEDCADDLAALAENLGVSSLIPVGYSMGGPIAMLTWRRHRQLVPGLVLCATAARFSQRPSDRMVISGMLGLSLAAAFSPASVQRRAMSRFVNNRFDGTPLGGWAADEIGRNSPSALLRAGAALGTFDAWPWLSEIDVPTSVVIPDADRVVPPAGQAALAEAIDGAEIFPVHGDHGVCATDPPSFVPVLVEACLSVTRRAEPARASTT